MKRKITSLLILLVAILISTSCSGQRIFSEVPSKDGINKIYVGKAMLRLAGSFEKVTDGVPSDAIKSIDGVEVINVEKKSLIKEVSAICQKVINQLQLEPATTIEDGNETTTIYIHPDPQNAEIATMLVVINDENTEYNAIAIHGKIDLLKLTQSFDH
ncbi:MAG: DUF4252 domain-containing protein [Muribaculaceae bacterium]|nr:DUF4252 domain-containing protein [Muribaculaceae bacterium]